MPGRIILDHRQLKKEIDSLKAQGKRIVFTNGCFDLLHVGHVRYLHGAKELADVLLVALNDDASVRTLKGEGQPLTPEAERAEIVAALEGVDFVTLFTEADVNALLLLLKPHVHAKGTDYTPETVPERDAVLSYGGEIAITGDPKGHSTSEIIKKMQDEGRE
ncbi:MAG: adenylyltransferase/cytidyltransferase family protein [Planctomycetota bacterium]|jgi:rfaE bifunctional protein nucleotidyltransferase chain/domain